MILHSTETAAARENAPLLEEWFRSLLQPPLQPIVHRDYKTVGVRLTLPGMAEDWPFDAPPPFGGCWLPLSKQLCSYVFSMAGKSLGGRCSSSQ